MTAKSMKWRTAWAALLCGWSATRTAAAADVRWLAPPGCVDARGTLEEAERLLGRPLSSVKTLDFYVRIAENEGHWTLKLSTVERSTTERGERVFEGQSCDEVTAAAAVAIAMVIHSNEAGAEESAGEDPSPGQSDNAIRAPDPRRRPAPVSRLAEPTRAKAPGGSRRLGLSLSLAALGDWGALPNAALGGELAGSVDYGPLRVTALGALLADSHEDASGKGTAFDLTLGALLICGRRAAGPAVASICGGAEAGQLKGIGVGVRNPRSGDSLWWAPRVDAAATFPLARNIAVFGRIGVTVPQVRLDFVLHDRLVHSPKSVTGRMALGIELGWE